jgi:hypothetical protein
MKEARGAGYADTVWTFATGKPALAGLVSLEYMVRDSQSQEPHILVR